MFFKVKNVVHKIIVGGNNLTTLLPTLLPNRIYLNWVFGHKVVR